jgi:hypothetical protein
MHQTTCGETHKVEIFDKSSVSDFLKKEKEAFDSAKKSNGCLYESQKIINNPTLNYLNEFFSKNLRLPNDQLKSILKKEFDDCEKIYPFLGEAFLNLFFDIDLVEDKNLSVVTEENIEDFINTSIDKNAKNISRWIVNNSSTDRVLEIEKSILDKILIKKEENTFFNIDYDADFLGTKSNWEMKNYRFAIIDGFIESVSEIHHMLHFAAQNKEPYVLFCFGMSEEVKNIIIQNNSKRITQIFPVSMTVNEDTINILNDIAVLHKSDIISSMKGQTISQEMRKELKVGKSISFSRRGFKISPLCEKDAIKSHINFLQKRIDEASLDSNTEIIKQRIKNLNSKTLKVYIPEELKKDANFNRELDYLLRMINSSQKPYVKVSFDRREIMIPDIIYRYLLKKVNTTKKMFYSIDKILIRKE